MSMLLTQQLFMSSTDLDPAVGSGPDKRIVIFGAGGHAVSVANVACAAGWRVKAFVDDAKAGDYLLGALVLNKLRAISLLTDCDAAIGIGDNFVRQRVCISILEDYPKARFPVLIHPAACISNFVKIDQGTVVMPNAVVGPNSSVGSFCVINTSSSLDHDSLMFDYSSLGPGSVTGGGVVIGKRSAVGIGATVRHNTKIGEDSVVGACSYVHKNVSDYSVAYGVPARIVRDRRIGETYL